MLEISTSDYQIIKKVQIDGVEFEVRPMTTSETMKLTALQEQTKNDQADGNKILKDLSDTFFNLFDKPEEAKKVFENISVMSWFDIYNKIMKEA